MLEYMIFDTLKTYSNNSIYYILFYLIILNKDTIILYIKKYFNRNLINNKYYTIEIIGWETMNNYIFGYDLPTVMIAINYYLFTKNLCNNLKYFDNKKNTFDMFGDNTNNNSLNYIINNINNITHIEDDIYILINSDITINNNNNNHTEINKIILTLMIKKENYFYHYNVKNNKINKLKNFIDKCLKIYEEFQLINNSTKQYHFIYQGCHTNNKKLSFTKKVISDSNPENDLHNNNETFNNLFHQHVEYIKDDIIRLNDKEYYKKHGLKRKKGYLFFGSPGTGKTATVMAIANYDNRHIIEVPLNRVKSNEELEKILDLKEINNINFTSNNIIILFDEIDIDVNLNKNNSFNDSYVLSKSSNKNNDFCSDDEVIINKTKFNFNTLLSRIDGIGNYDGLIIIATTNDISKIDKSLYREGRLTLIIFNNASTNDIINIIKNYYNLDINNKEYIIIEKMNNLYSHSEIKYNLEKYKNIKDFLYFYSTKKVFNNEIIE